MPKTIVKQGEIIIARADIDTNSIDSAAKEFDVVFATENPVTRSPWWSDETFNEVLVCNKTNIRSARLDEGVVPLLDTHNSWGVANQYGIVRSWSIKDGVCRARIAYSTQEAKKDMWGDIENKIIRGISVGAKIYKYERVPGNDPKAVPTYRAVDWEVTEISLAPVPADYMSSTRSEDKTQSKHQIEILNYKTTRSIMTQLEIKELRTSCRAAGLSDDYADELIARCIAAENPLTMDAARAEILAAKKPAVPAAAEPPVPAPVAQRSEAEIAAERFVEIHKLVRTQRHLAPESLTEEYADTLITRKLTIDQARAEIMERTAAVKGGGPANGGGAPSAKGDEKDHTLRAMTEGLMQRAEPGSVERYYQLEPKAGEGYTKGQRMDVKAHDYKYMKLSDIARTILEINGVTNTRSMSNAEVAKRALHTTDMADLFTSVIKRFMRQNYEAVVPEWEQFSRLVTADDFRVKTGVKFDMAVTFEEIAEDGEYKESNLMSNEKATLQLKTYARQFGISRYTIINDDLGVINEIPRFIALGGRQFQSKKAWGLITDNAVCPDGHALFSAAHKNLAAGGGVSVIGDAALSAGRVAMRRQKSPEGNELMIRPKYLLVPPELETRAQKIVTPINPNTTDDVNIWRGLQPFVNDYFIDTKAWYMVADPRSTTADGMVHSYLSGEEGLFTESYRDLATDKVIIKARLDYDVKMWGHQGWYKNPGAAEAVSD